jgi:hypothetical protein
VVDSEEEEEEDIEEDEDEVEEVKVTGFAFEGKKYLRSPDNTVFDAETQDEIGMWNEETNKIEFA